MTNCTYKNRDRDRSSYQYSNQYQSVTKRTQQPKSKIGTWLLLLGLQLQLQLQLFGVVLLTSPTSVAAFAPAVSVSPNPSPTNPSTTLSRIQMKINIHGRSHFDSGSGSGIPVLVPVHVPVPVSSRRHAALSLSPSSEPQIESKDMNSNNNNNNNNNNNSSNNNTGRRRSIFRNNVKRLFFSSSNRKNSSKDKENKETSLAARRAAVDAAFRPAEEALDELERSLRVTRDALENARAESMLAVERSFELDQLQWQASPQSELATAASDMNGFNDIDDDEPTSIDLSALTFEDIDYESSEMAPPFLDPNACLLPDAEPVVRVEKAPDNSRRIWAGIDILASADDVWNVLTNYAELQNVIPNLVVNDVLALYDGDIVDNEDNLDNIIDIDDDDDESLPEALRCEKLSRTQKGSLLKQVGGAKVAGIRFSATTTLEVREWPTGLPDFAHFCDSIWEGQTREERARDYARMPLQRYKFPRPFCISELPTKDISMQSIVDDDGEFRLYQGVWRMQPLVGCSPPGKHAMRLTYAVEISPRPYLPVRLVEGRIVKDLCSNLEAIRAAVTNKQ